MIKKEMKFDKQTINHANKCENICDSYFAFMTGTTGWFNSVFKNPNGSKTDYKGIDVRHRHVTIELKNRNVEPYQYDDIMIEPNKYSALTGATTDKSWYICFFKDEKTFWVVDINQSLNDKIIIKKNVDIKIKQLGDNYTYTADRYYINRKYGYFYEYDENEKKYIKKQ